MKTLTQLAAEYSAAKVKDPALLARIQKLMNEEGKKDAKRYLKKKK